MPQIITTERYWDCECEHDYIHKACVLQCDKCNSLQDDQPNSHTNEVQAMLTKDLARVTAEMEDILIPVLFVDDQEGICHLQVEKEDTIEIVTLLSDVITPYGVGDAYDLILNFNGRQCFADSLDWGMSDA